jgi:hypothetical protein
MKTTQWADRAVIVLFALAAVLAIAAPLTGMGAPVRPVAVFGGILLGPSGLAYRLATGRRWTECLSVGAAINIALVMLVGELLVAIHFWHPVPFEILIPITTCILCARSARRRVMPMSERTGL